MKSPEPDQSRPALIVLFALVGLFVSCAAMWIYLNQGPTRWDDSGYLADSLRVLDGLAHGGLPGWFHAYLNIQAGSKAPLICVLPTPIYLVFGRNPRLAFGVNLVFLGMLLIAVFRIGRKFWGDRAGLLAVLVTGTLPMVYGVSRVFFVECGLISITCWAIVLLVGSDDLTRSGFVVLFGIVCGLGMLQKLAFPVYVAPLAIFFIVRRFRRPVVGQSSCNRIGSMVRMLLAMALPALIIAGPWYVANFHSLITRAVYSGFTDAADRYGTGSVFTISAVAQYLASNIGNESTSPFYPVLGALIAFALFSFGRWRPWAQRLGNPGGIILGLWALPFIVFLFGRNKDPRYVSPILPAFGLFMGVTIDSALSAARLDRRRWTCAAAMIGIFAFPLLALCNASFRLFPPMECSVGPFIFLSPRQHLAYRYENSSWPLEEMIKYLVEISPNHADRRTRLLICSDSSHLNAPNVRLAVLASESPVDVATTAYAEDFDALLPSLQSADFALYSINQTPDPGGFDSLHDRVFEYVQNAWHFREIPCPVSQPRGGTLHLFQKLPEPQPPDRSKGFIAAELAEVVPCRVSFDGKIELTGFYLARDGAHVSARFRWRCVAPVSQAIRVFGHIADENGTVVGWMDHDIAGNSPPITTWRAGDTAYETVETTISAAGNQPLIIKVGFYDPATMRRLPITGADLPGANVASRSDGDASVHIRIISATIQPQTGQP